MPNSNSTPETKTCKKCGRDFPKTSEYFHNQDTCKDGLRPECKQCHAERHRAWRETHKEEKQAMDKRWREENLERKRANDKAYYEANKEAASEWGRQYREKNKVAISIRRRGYRERHADRIRQQQKRYLSQNKEAIVERRRMWRERNKELIAQKKREEYLANPEKVKSRVKAWEKENPSRVKASRVIRQSRRRARKLALPDTFTQIEWVTCLEYFHYCCAVCGKQLRDLLGEVEPHADHWIPIASELCTGTIAKNMVCLCNACNTSKNAKLPEQWLIEKYGKRKAKAILARVQAYFDSLED